MNIYIKILTAITVISLLGIEIVGRYYRINVYPTYEHSSKYEYVLDSNQKIKFYSGNVFSTNSHGMRSEEVSNKKKKILLIGDSVLYGGSNSDNSEIASSILQNLLDNKDENIQVLNISANSWGPDNAAAYIEEHGTFDSKMVVLVFSSHDAFDNMTHEPIVGVDYRYPDNLSYFALQDFFSRAFRKVKRTIFKKQINQHQINSSNQTFNSGFEAIFKVCRRNKIPVIVYHHLEQDEIVNDKINNKGRIIEKFCTDHQVPFYTELNMQPKIDYLSDHIHFNPEGQKYLASNLFRIIDNHLNIFEKERQPTTRHSQ